LTSVNLSFNNLIGGNFAGQKLTDANFAAANLTGANFREANLANANFVSYGDCIPGLGCSDNRYATLTDADLTAADARGAQGLDDAISFSGIGATTENLIWPDGHIRGLDLNAGGLLVVRDYDECKLWWCSPPGPIPIMVDEHLTMGPGGMLRMVFEADAWDSTISFAPSIPVTLGGTLELTFAADVNPATQLGRTFDLFDWTGVNPTGTFAVSSTGRHLAPELYSHRAGYVAPVEMRSAHPAGSVLAHRICSTRAGGR
jgi:hypothetical protein